MKLIRIYSILILAILLLPSCIRDNLDDCGMDVELYFRYPDFPERIHKVNVGIMNESGRLLRVKQMDKANLEEFQGVRTHLPTGNYTAVCWGNTFEETRLKGLDYDKMCHNMLLDHPLCGTDQKICTNDSLFYGRLSFSVPKYEKNFTYRDTVDYDPAHITFEIYVFGLETTRLGASATGYPFIQINNLYPEYNYEMKTQGEFYTYHPRMYISNKNKMASAETHVLRFTNENPIEIVVDEPVPSHYLIPYKLNLKEFLKDQKFIIEDKEEYRIRIAFYFDSGGVQIRLLGWEGIGVEDPF